MGEWPHLTGDVEPGLDPGPMRERRTFGAKRSDKTKVIKDRRPKRPAETSQLGRRLVDDLVCILEDGVVVTALIEGIECPR